MEGFAFLPGQKTANLILGDVHNTPGVVVADTHCIRITELRQAHRRHQGPRQGGKQPRACLPPEESNDFLPFTVPGSMAGQYSQVQA